MYQSILLMILTVSVFSNADTLDRELAGQMSVAKEQNRSYWPQYLSETERICRLTKETDREKEQCLQKLVETSKKVLGCEKDVSLWREMDELDFKLTQDIFAQYPQTEVPENIRAMYGELVRLADELIETSRPDLSLPMAYFPPPQWTFSGYTAPVYNAQAGAGGRILMSSAFWGGNNVFSEDEIRAVLAHEVAHVIHNHSLQMGCLAFEWAQGQHGLAESFEMLFEGMFPTGPKGEARAKLSQRNEFHADEYAMVLLKKLNYDPQAMTRALQKLAAASGSGGFSTGSHPEMAERIERARNRR